MELLFTTYTITKLERDNGKVPYTLLLGQGTMDSLLKFVKAGLLIEDDKIASEKIDEYLKTGKTAQDLHVEIVGKLEEGHFLDKGARKAAMDQLKAQREEQAKILSETSGKEEK